MQVAFELRDERTVRAKRPWAHSSPCKEREVRGDTGGESEARTDGA